MRKAGRVKKSEPGRWRRGNEVSVTLRWREMDSNFWYRGLARTKPTSCGQISAPPLPATRPVVFPYTESHRRLDAAARFPDWLGSSASLRSGRIGRWFGHSAFPISRSVDYSSAKSWRAYVQCDLIATGITEGHDSS